MVSPRLQHTAARAFFSQMELATDSDLSKYVCLYERFLNHSCTWIITINTDNFTQPWNNATEIMWPLVRQLVFPEKQQSSNLEITGVISLAFGTKHTFQKWNIYPNKPRNNNQTDYLRQKSKFSLVEFKDNLHQLKACICSLAISALVK